MRARTVKKIVHAGRGALPEFKDGTKAIFDYQAQILPDTNVDEIPKDVDLPIIDDTRKGWPHGYGIPLEIIYGKKFQMPVWEECLQTMLVDEVCTFDIQPIDLVSYPMVSKKLRDIAKDREFGDKLDDSHHHHGCFGLMSQTGLGYTDLDTLMQDPKPVRFTFHLLKVLQPEDYEPDSWQLDPEQKLESITDLKTKGKELFMAKKWDEAAEVYREAIARLESLLLREKPGEPEYIEFDQMKTPLYLNISQCKLNVQSYYEAVEMASEALKRDETNEKGLFRRAKAYIGTWDFQPARKDLEILIKFHPNMTKVATEELRKIEKLEDVKRNEEKSQFGNIFVK